MKRRTFIAVAGVSGLLAGAFSFRFFSETFEDAGVDIIKRELPFLRLDPAGVRAFMRDYALGQDAAYKRAIRLYKAIGVGSERSGKVHQLVSQYLLSTDFFRNNADENRVIKFVGLYNPYLTPCAHPFSHLVYSPTKGSPSES